MKKKPSLKEKYSELGQQSLIKVQYSCSGFGTDVSESHEYIPIVPEDVRTISRLEYLEAEMDDVEAIIGHNGDVFVGFTHVRSETSAGILHPDQTLLAKFAVLFF